MISPYDSTSYEVVVRAPPLTPYPEAMLSQKSRVCCIRGRSILQITDIVVGTSLQFTLRAAREALLVVCSTVFCDVHRDYVIRRSDQIERNRRSDTKSSADTLNEIMSLVQALFLNGWT